MKARAKAKAKSRGKAKTKPKTRSSKAATTQQSVSPEELRRQEVQMAGSKCPQMERVSGTVLQRLTKRRLSPERRRLLEVLLNPVNRFKTVTDLCQMAGCSRETYYYAYRNPDFVAIQEELALDVVKQAILPTIHAFAKEAARGSFQHGNVLMEMAGIIEKAKRGREEDTEAKQFLDALGGKASEVWDNET